MQKVAKKLPSNFWKALVGRIILTNYRNIGIIAKNSEHSWVHNMLFLQEQSAKA